MQGGNQKKFNATGAAPESRKARGGRIFPTLLAERFSLRRTAHSKLHELREWTPLQFLDEMPFRLIAKLECRVSITNVPRGTVRRLRNSVVGSWTKPNGNLKRIIRLPE